MGHVVIQNIQSANPEVGHSMQFVSHATASRSITTMQIKYFFSPRVHLIRAPLTMAAIALSFLLVGSPSAKAQGPMMAFSADEVHTSAKMTMRSKVFGTDNAIRVEAQMAGHTTVSIMRFDRQVMWMLMPGQKMYMEMPWRGVGEVASTLKGATTQKESLGSELVGTYHCDKSRVHTTYNGKTYVTIEWAAKELNGFVVKKQDENGTWTVEFENIHLGPQDPSLFEIPAGYQKMEMPAGMPTPQQ